MQLSTLFTGALAGATIVWIASKLFRRWAISHFTVMFDLPSLGAPRKDGRKIGDTAIICGGSVAGLLAARVCTDHFERVLVIDPDAVSLVAGARAANAASNPPAHARVMQYSTFHSLQGIFSYGVGRLFPTVYERELAAAGAVLGSARFNVHTGGHLVDVSLDQLPVPMRTAVGLTRAAHETVLRRMVAADKRIEFVSGTILGFDVDPQDAKKLAGVRYRPASDAKAVLSIKGDLIIDCTGVSRSGLTLLQRASPAYALPKSVLETYQPAMRYTSCAFQNASTVLAPFVETADTCEKNGPLVAIFVPVGGETRWLGMVRAEKNMLYVLAGGAGFTGSIESVAELRTHVQAIRGPKPLPAWVFAVIDKLEEQDAEFPGKYSTANISAMHWVKYHEHADTLPANYVALGDAWMRMNPVFGQGMAKALVEATTLDGVLRAAAGPAVGRAFFARAAARTGGSWTQTKIGDYAHDTCVPAAGETREVGARSRAFGARLGKHTLRGDKDLQRRMLGVRAWVLPETDMMAPSVLAKLALDWVRGR